VAAADTEDAKSVLVGFLYLLGIPGRQKGEQSQGGEGETHAKAP
jgi:hypothetical protein